MLLSVVMAAHQGRLRWGRKPTPNGQVLYSSAGTHQWICPPNVTRVSVVLVGAGGAGNRGRFETGSGGNVRFINDIPVVPGQTYAIVLPGVNNGSRLAVNTTSAFGYTAASPLGGAVMGGNGTDGLTGQYSEMASGGNVGFVPSGRNSHGIDLKTFSATGPTGTFYRNGGRFGGGGGLWRDRSDGDGGPAGVRIIWGENRAFPDLNIGDL